MTQGVLKTHGNCLMMYFKNNWNAGPFFLLHGYLRRKQPYIKINYIVVHIVITVATHFLGQKVELKQDLKLFNFL
jgi:hypothetical protein